MQVRVRELLSKLEATYINRTVVIVSADSNYLSVMESMVRGTDATMHHDLAFAPGEVRELLSISDLDAIANGKPRRLIRPIDDWLGIN